MAPPTPAPCFSLWRASSPYPLGPCGQHQPAGSAAEAVKVWRTIGLGVEGSPPSCPDFRTCPTRFCNWPSGSLPRPGLPHPFPSCRLGGPPCLGHLPQDSAFRENPLCGLCLGIFRTGRLLWAGQSDSSRGTRDLRNLLTSPRLCFSSSRRRFADALGWVARRTLGGWAAKRRSRTRRATASARLRSWLRNRRASRIRIPAAEARRPASSRRRLRRGSGREGQWATSKRNCAVVATLLTFWPPGPGERTKWNSSSSRSKARVGVIWIRSTLAGFP